MKHYSSFLLVFFALPLYTVAQSNFQPGLIVNSKGDTIHGAIDFREWENSPKTILFKPDGAAEPQKLKAAR